MNNPLTSSRRSHSDRYLKSRWPNYVVLLNKKRNILQTKYKTKITRKANECHN